jgi:dTDP-glucose 4,6-dehydratase/UDP-glucose 4-epimerase
MSRALVVGGLGFIGSNLTRRLAARGDAVTVLTPAIAAHADVTGELSASGVHIVEGDIRDERTMARLVEGCDVVFNVSGHSGAVRSVADPVTDLDVNYRGTLVLAEAVRRVSPATKIVQAGSRLHYGHPETIPVSESAPAQPLSFHALHKSAAESTLTIYARLFGIRSVTARITNPYGPGQPRERSAYGVINRLVHLAVQGEPMTIYGDGRQLRDYLHVDDVTRALVAMADAPTAGARVYNVGSGIGTAIIDAARLIIDIAGGSRIEHVEWPPVARQVETGDFVADVSRIGAELGWRPAIALRQGLEQTVRHYRAHAHA